MLRNDLTDVEQRFQLTPGVIGHRGRSSVRRRNRSVRHSARIASRGEWLNPREGGNGSNSHAAGPSNVANSSNGRPEWTRTHRSGRPSRPALNQLSYESLNHLG